MMVWKRSLPLVSTTALLVLLTPGTTQGADVSVHFIESPQFDFFMAPNLTIGLGSGAITLPRLNKCGCNSACFTLGDWCKAWAITSLGEGTTECRIANEGPMSIVPETTVSSTYFFKKSSVPGTYRWQADNLLYVELNNLMTTQEARQNCAKLPGHRLVIVKSRETYEPFVKLGQGQSAPYWTMDLQKSTPTEFVWGDGTPATETYGSINSNMDTELAFILFDAQIHDAPESMGPFRVLCQANPLGLEW